MDHPAGLQKIGQQGPAATWPFFAISTVLFLLRSYSRLRLHTEALGWDDLVISISWVGELGIGEDDGDECLTTVDRFSV